ncbi:MAG: hypothetical protein K2O85_04660 [Helicobacter sp.]|nr:hypothetical protein [Helicobacter sp.]
MARVSGAWVLHLESWLGNLPLRACTKQSIAFGCLMWLIAMPAMTNEIYKESVIIIAD